jgi:acyl-CoA thioester hydrolase
MKNYKATYRVYYEDTDAGGVVFYGNYLKFAERGRTDFLRQSGVNQQALAEATGKFFVVRNVKIDYLNPGRLDDLITVDTNVIKTGKTSVIMSQDFYNQHNTPLAKMEVQIVCVKNVEGSIKSTAMPEEVANFFNEE